MGRVSVKENKKTETKKEKKTVVMDEKLKKCLDYLNHTGLSEAQYVAKFEAACEFFDKEEIENLISQVKPSTKKILEKKSTAYKEYVPDDNSKKNVKEEATTEKKAPAKKAAAKAETVITLEFGDYTAIMATVEEKVKAQFVAEGHKASSIKTLNIYVKPFENSAYYVVNGDVTGRVDLF